MRDNNFILNFAPMQVRLDTYLWAIRMFKSRTIATTAIKSGKVKLNDAIVKSSHYVKIGEIFIINIGSVNKKIVEAVELINKRKEYELVKNCYIDLSPKIEKEQKMENMFFNINIQQEKGSGRPTKKNRRDLGKQGGWF